MAVEPLLHADDWKLFAQSLEDFALILMDLDAHITDWNTGAQRLFGYSRSDVLGKSGEIIFVPEDRDAGAPQREISTALHEGRAEDERWHLRSDGTRFRASGVLTTMKDGDGRPRGFSKVIRDVTRKEHEREQLERNLAERTTLIREIQHRVKNNLQMIVSLISLQSNRLTGNESREALQELQLRVRTIAAVHETLYATPDFGTISMPPLLNQLSRNLRGVYNGEGRIQFDLTCVDLALDIREALPLALIANELMSNTLRHAYPDHRSGRLSVDLSYTPPAGAGATPLRASLAISDDGIGLPDGIVFETSNTLGFELVRILADQLHGQVSMRTNHGGCCFEIIFPVAVQ